MIFVVGPAPARPPPHPDELVSHIVTPHTTPGAPDNAGSSAPAWWMTPYSRAKRFASAADPVIRCSQNPYATDLICSSVRYSCHRFTPWSHHAVRT